MRATRVAHGGFTHEALIYRSDDDLLSVAVPFLSEGAEAGEPALVTLDDRQQRQVLHELGEAAAGVTPLEPGHRGDPLSALHQDYRLFARLLRGGARRIRVVRAVQRDARGRWVRYEAAINHLFAPFPITGLCPYDARTTPSDVLDDVERTHPHLVFDDDAVVGSPRYEDPATLLAERARAAADPLEALPPDLMLADPGAERAARAVRALAARTRLDRDSADALRLSVGHVVMNALVHGRRPVRLRAWRAPDRVVVKVTDAGSGPHDPYVGLLPRDPEAELEDANALHIIHRALSDVAFFTDADGFTVRLVERRRASG